MVDFLASMNEWHWLVFGIVLVVAEITLPGTFLLWPGLAAVIVGLTKAIVPGLDWTVCVTLWAVLSVVTVAGFIAWRKTHPAKGGSSTLNRRGEQYVGERFYIETPVVNGKGEMKVDDTVWKILSDQDLPAGASVKVVGVEGTSLRVESF
jgi:membrane protein implicated in regulation of membrane protease activity